jgi:putative transposase
VLLEREGIYLSAKSIDRVIGRLKARGVVKEPQRPRRVASAHGRRLRRPLDLVVDTPGVLVQLDSKQVALGVGKVVFQFGAVDCFTRKRVVALAPRLTSQQGADFLRWVVKELPFPVTAIQSDGGSEFLGAFGAAVKEMKLLHYFNRPNYPQGNDRVERSLRTDEEEFYQVEELPRCIGARVCPSCLEPCLRASAAPPSLGLQNTWAFLPGLAKGKCLKKGGIVRYVLTL